MLVWILNYKMFWSLKGEKNYKNVFYINLGEVYGIDILVLYLEKEF